VRVLVLGGTRFIGAAAVRRLHELGNEVAVFHRGKTQGSLPDGVVEIHGDRDRLAEHRSAFQEFHPEVVLHNIVINERHAVEAMETFRGLARRLVLVSSCDVFRAYGRITGIEPGPPDPIPLTEDSPLRETRYPYRSQANDPGHLLYDYDKIPAEEAALGDPDLPGTVLRLPMVIGPGDYQHRLFGLLKPMTDRRPAIVLPEDYAAWKSTYGYVDNVAEAIARACTDERAAGQVYVVGDWPLSILEQAEEIRRLLGWPGELVLRPRETLPEALVEKMDTTQHLVCSCRKIQDELGYRERIGLKDAIRRTVEWERAHPPDPIPPGTLKYRDEDEVLAAIARGE
jgi:nucleoside-diphosphate-sugar epimerase